MRAADYPLTLFFDGACPICRFEMDRLRDRDGLRRLAFVDICAPQFDPRAWPGTHPGSLDDMKRLIHALRPDGSMAIGVDALTLAYRAVGLGHWLLPASLPLLRPLCDRAYAAFARNRYAVSALLMPLLARTQARGAQRRMKSCEGACGMDSNGGSS